jgi:hypothetical protein
MASFGTYSLADLLAAQVPLVQFGEDNAFQAISDALAVHNRITNEIIGDLADVTTDQLRRYGGPSSMVMLPADQFSRVDAQKLTAGSNIGFPLAPYQVSLQWTRFSLERMQTNELAVQFTAAQDADIKNLQLLLKTAIYTPTAYTFVDNLVNGLLLPVKPFLSADSQPIPLGPNGEVFNAATHTHYLGVASAGAPTQAEVYSAIETVIEHYATGQPTVAINRADETKIRAFAGFQPYFDSRVSAASTITRGTAGLDPIALYNRAIGILDGAEIWVKPWAISGYAFTWMRGAPKPLVIREEPNAPAGLRMMADNEQFPLRANTMQRVTGVGVWNRPNGSVLDMATGSSTYTIPAVTVT